ncbi:MAG: hypothetical protein WBA77_08710 [Microcoleaceae cyanobacterium]
MLNITNLVKGLALTASSVALSVGIVGARSAIAQDAVFWDVEFLDESGVVVGEGEFSYDPTTTTFVNTTPDFLSIPPEGFEVQTALETASFNVFGQGFVPAGNLTWWFESDRDPGQQFVNRRGEPDIRDNSWTFLNSDVRDATAILFMDDFEQVSDTLGMGDWTSDGFDFTIGQSLSGSGQWRATNRLQSVPEPRVTLSLFAFSVLGAASICKRKS